MVDSEKYDVLEKIGMDVLEKHSRLDLIVYPGHGSFGVIHKVRRRCDGQVLLQKNTQAT